MSTPVIEAHGLVKRYGPATAVDGIDLAVNEGEVFGLLGPNGSGKTTTILMLLGLTEPTEGSIRIAGIDPMRAPLEAKRFTGYLPDAVGFYDTMTARENLVFTARLAGIPRAEAARRIDEALVRVGIDHAAARSTRGFSHGMRQRLGLAELLVKQAKILILDEPTNGLDPQATNDLLRLIGDLRREGMTILLSSHMLGLVQSVCDRVALFHQGRIGLLGTVEELSVRVRGSTFVVEVEAENIDLASVLNGLPGVVSVDRSGPEHARIEAESDIRPAIAKRIVEKRGLLCQMALKRVSLDDVYASYFEKQKELQDAA